MARLDNKNKDTSAINSTVVFFMSLKLFAILAIFMPEFGVWTTLYSVMFAVFAIGWGFWLGIIAIVVNLTNLLIFSSDMFIKPGFAIFAVSLILECGNTQFCYCHWTYNTQYDE
jgi:uncharacterized membrane protein